MNEEKNGLYIRVMRNPKGHWKMSFHEDKCTFMFATYYNPHGHQLESLEGAKRRSLSDGHDLSWKRHAKNVYTKQTKMLGFLLRILVIN